MQLHGIQIKTDNESEPQWGDEDLAWDQVRAACKAQPVDCRFPYPEKFSKLVESVSEEMARRAESGEDFFERYWKNPRTKQRLIARFDDGVTGTPGRHNKNKDKTDWRSIQLFKFGLMSFLLPRYLVMMNGDSQFFTDYAQWTGNNDIPSNPFEGNKFGDGKVDSAWWEVKEMFEKSKINDEEGKKALACLANIPSQAVCARWMPNLAGICKANHAYSLFGINIRDSEEDGELSVENVDIEIFSPYGGNSNAGQYILDGVTVRDGWGSELYYYSPSPYQRYTLWSAGPNRRTFPPWVSRKSLKSKDAKKCVAEWTHDDIISLSN